MIALKPERRSEFVRFVVKGAPEFVFPLCTNYVNSDGVE